MCKSNDDNFTPSYTGNVEMDKSKLAKRNSVTPLHKCCRLAEETRNSPSTCRCGGRACSNDGGIWNPTTDYRSACGDAEPHCGDGSLHDNRISSQEESKEEAEKRQTEKKEAESRSAQHPAMQSLRLMQDQEFQRFNDFKKKTQEVMRARQQEYEVSLDDRYKLQQDQANEKHVEAVSQLEDQQITEEMELRVALKQSARAINMRIKHMEAYCTGFNRVPSDPSLPPRVVTEQNLRDLGSQYNQRDNLERHHAAKINMMRDRQTKSMEGLLERQREEQGKLSEERQQEQGIHLKKSLQEAEAIECAFEARKSRLTARWNLAIVVLCKELEAKEGVTYAPIATPCWPDANETNDQATATL